VFYFQTIDGKGVSWMDDPSLENVSIKGRNNIKRYFYKQNLFASSNIIFIKKTFFASSHVILTTKLFTPSNIIFKRGFFFAGMRVVRPYSTKN
jgi:hypothetical protein